MVQPTLLMAVVDQPEQVVGAALDAAWRAHLLVEQHDAYHFAHDVVREVVEADLGLARRTALHRRVADALERQPGERPVALLAYHYGRGNAPDKAVLYLEQAGERAQAQYANAAAEAYYRELVERLDRLGHEVDAARAREKLGAVLRTVGQCDAALEVLAQAAATYRARGELEHLGRATAEIGRVHYDRGSPEEGVLHVQPVLDLLDARGASGGLAALYPVLGVLFVHSCRYTEVLAATARAAELARALGDDRVLAEAAMFRGHALYFMGRSDEALPVLEEAIRLSEAVGDLATLPAVLHMASYVYRDRGEFERVRLYVERAFAAAERRGNPALIAQMLRARGSSAFLRGDWAQARADLERAVAMSRQLGLGWVPLYLLLDLGRLRLAEGTWADASRYLDEGMALAESRGDVRGRRYLEIALAERDVLEGRPDAACARLVSVLEQRGELEWGVATLLALLAWAYLELGEIGQAEEVVGQAITRARATNNRLGLVDVLRVQAMLMTRQKRWAEAASSLEEGLALARNMPYPYGEARLLHVYGMMHVQKGEPARERLEAALAIFRQLGARKDSERVAQAIADLHRR